MRDVYLDYFRALTSRYDMMRGNRQSPFINFRNESDSVEEEAEKPIPVTRYFNGKKMVAEMLMSDGSIILADQYIPGEDGYIIAQWMEPAATLKIHIMNLLLKDNAIQLEEETTGKGKGKKGMKTKGKSKGKKKGKDIIAKRPAGLLAASFERASKKLHVEVDDDEEKLSEKAAEEPEEEDENNP